jgi:hypothetical protein
VHDVALMRELGQDLGVEESKLDGFAREHADHVVITADFPEEKDSWWTYNDVTRAECEATFGKFDDKTLPATREFAIVDAQQQVLSLDPVGSPNPDAPHTLVDLLRVCFPAGSSYLIRASAQWVLRGSVTGFRHKIVAKWEKEAGSDYLECERDCNPRKQYFESRVFEIVSRDALDQDPMLPNFCVANQSTGVTLGEPAKNCIHDTPTARFAVYRGDQASVRDMIFSWQTIGGFSTLRIDLAAVSSTVSPQTLVGLSAFNWLSVVDASSLGLALLSLDTLSTLTPTLY